ncbi:hypothetical protein [Actinomadura hibisca]|uniref:hypothetical protein n=1 Tax=Actinomadura hibisca TaxID=68565 RepID=UPI00082E237C|nr:hypothetical protein [Actinomadura hibisca]
MFRRILVLPVLLLALAVSSACGGNSQSADTRGAVGSTTTPATSITPTASDSPEVCPSEQTKKFAKTRFTADAGLAFGAFHRWIYKPYQAGTFNKDAEGRTKAFVKAGAAAAFAANRLNAARKMVNADPKLCGALKKPLDSLTNSLGGMVDKLKSGDINPAEIGAVGGAIDSFKSDASKNGAGITERTPPSLDTN